MLEEVEVWNGSGYAPELVGERRDFSEFYISCHVKWRRIVGGAVSVLSSFFHLSQQHFLVLFFPVVYPLLS